MNIGVWMVQAVLATLYLMAGLWKLAGQEPTLHDLMPGIPLFLIRCIGAAETNAAVALVMPAVNREWMMRAKWAALFLAAEAVVFFVYHAARGVWGPAVATLVLGGLAGFVAWGRTQPDLE